MAIYTNLEATNNGQHGIAESSNLKATVCGNIYDCLVKDSDGDAIAVDNGVAVCVGEYTGNGLQERNATIAAVGDKIGFVCSPAIIKDAFTKAQSDEWNFYHKAGQLAKVYEVVENDIFGIADYQITGDVEVGKYIVVDGNGAWEVKSSAPSTSTYGYIGKVHSIATANYSTIVRVKCIQNVQNATLSI